jgi:adenosylmethionine-8-amino-7-oxononanoate aminotransferase
MMIKRYKGTPYHLWNPYTEMDQFISFLGMGPTIITRGEGHYVYNDRGRRYINSNSAMKKTNSVKKHGASQAQDG